MSKQGLMAVAIKFTEDESFRKQLAEDPRAALSGFDLNPEEVAAVMERDEGKLISLGLDERITKGTGPGEGLQ